MVQPVAPGLALGHVATLGPLRPFGSREGREPGPLPPAAVSRSERFSLFLLPTAGRPGLPSRPNIRGHAFYSLFCRKKAA